MADAHVSREGLRASSPHGQREPRRVARTDASRAHGLRPRQPSGLGSVPQPLSDAAEAVPDRRPPDPDRISVDHGARRRADHAPRPDRTAPPRAAAAVEGRPHASSVPRSRPMTRFVKPLLLDGYSTRTLACVRSWGQRGIAFAVGGESRWDMSLFSRYSRETFVYTSPK